jgi:2-(1,2-epoxy-1,2-dihydrophenyl)acetyl-CoA isomerase
MLDLSVSDGLAVITFDRPDVLNAFNDELGTQAVQALEKASSDGSVRCIVITGAGRAFSSGEDLAPLAEDYRQGKAPELGRTLVDRYNPFIRAIRAAPKPVVAAVNGVAAGAGASIALACDFRVASEHAKLVLAFVKVGLVPDAGATWFLTKMVGSARTMELAATGSALTAERAYELGIFNVVVPSEGFEETWRSYAADLAQGPTRAYALIKGLVNSAMEFPLDVHLDNEVAAQTEAGRTADHMEGVQAFFDKRAPSFEGR